MGLFALQSVDLARLPLFDTLFRGIRASGLEALLVNDPEGIVTSLTDTANYQAAPRLRAGFCVRSAELGFSLPKVPWSVVNAASSRAHSRLPMWVFYSGTSMTQAFICCVRVEKTTEVNLSKAFQDTALEAVLRALFSTAESVAREKLHAMVRYYVQGPGRVTVFDALAKSENSFAFANGKRIRFQKAWSSSIDGIVAERKSCASPTANRDLLDLLLNLRDPESGEAISDVEIRDQCATMLAAGSETSARLMFWACYLLANDTAEQQRVLPKSPLFLLNVSRFLMISQNWPRLRNVLLEALRLYPPVAHLRREVVGPERDMVKGSPRKCR